MNLLYKILSLSIDFARGVHIWPALNWIYVSDISQFKFEVLLDLKSLDLHLLVAFVVIAESIHSLCHVKSST